MNTEEKSENEIIISEAEQIEELIHEDIKSEIELDDFDEYLPEH